MGQPENYGAAPLRQHQLLVAAYVSLIGAFGAPALVEQTITVEKPDAVLLRLSVGQLPDVAQSGVLLLLSRQLLGVCFQGTLFLLAGTSLVSQPHLRVIT